MREVRLVDDIDGSVEAVLTVRIEVDGDRYEIDLGSKNRTKYLDPLLKHARRGERPPPIVPIPSRVRQWARSRGIDVPPRGGIPQRIVDLYLQAHTEE